MTTEAGAMLGGVTVAVLESRSAARLASTVSAADGSFSLTFDGGVGGGLVVVASAPGYVSPPPQLVSGQDLAVLSLRAFEAPMVREPSGQAAVGVGAIVGRVRDEASGRPLPHTAVRVSGVSEVATTDEKGRFRVGIPGGGERRVQFEGLGFQPVRESVLLGSGETLYMDVRMSADPITLSPVIATVVAKPHLKRAADLQHRIDLGHGSFIRADQLKARGFPRVRDVLTAIPGVYLHRSGVPAFRRAASLNECLPTLWLDGVKLMDWQLGLQLHSRDVDMVEIYKGPATTPAEYLDSDSHCGVVAIWTLRGNQVPLSELIEARASGGTPHQRDHP